MTYLEKPWQKSYFIGPFKLKKTMAPYPKINVYKFLKDATEEYPDNIALAYLNTELTYTQLLEDVNRFANALLSLNVQKGDMVSTVLPTCPQFVIADYAIMGIGAVHVPLSILHKAPELRYELATSKSKVLICSSRRLERALSIKDETSLEHIIHTPVPIFPDYELLDMETTPNVLSFEE
ncbi:MAG: AMP-binding protein, partial [Candidatus Heimdallarchaeota archaeon]